MNRVATAPTSRLRDLLEYGVSEWHAAKDVVPGILSDSLEAAMSIRAQPSRLRHAILAGAAIAALAAATPRLAAAQYYGYPAPAYPYSSYPYSSYPYSSYPYSSYPYSGYSYSPHRYPHYRNGDWGRNYGGWHEEGWRRNAEDHRVWNRGGPHPGENREGSTGSSQHRGAAVPSGAGGSRGNADGFVGWLGAHAR
jgi:hypothetical protein